MRALILFAIGTLFVSCNLISGLDHGQHWTLWTLGSIHYLVAMMFYLEPTKYAHS